MRVIFILYAIVVGVINSQEYNYNAPQQSQPQRLYNAPPPSPEVENNNQGYHNEAPSQLYETPQQRNAPSRLYETPQQREGYKYDAPSRLYDTPQLAPPQPSEGYNYEAPSQLYDAPQSREGYNYEAPSQLYDSPQSAPPQPSEGYNYEAPSQLYDAPQLPPQPSKGYNYEAPSQLYDAPQLPPPQPRVGYNYDAPSKLYDSPPVEPQQGYNYNPPQESQYVPTLEKMPSATPTPELSKPGYNYEAPTPSQLYSPPTTAPEPVQQPKPKYLPPKPQATAPPVEKYLPPQQSSPPVGEISHPEQLSTHLTEIKEANAAGLDLPKSYNYKSPSEISVSKHFFIPQSKSNVTPKGYNYGPPAKTHYRVIFIRTPTPEKEQFLDQQHQVEEEKTVIYVLNQQPKGQTYLPPTNTAPTTLQTKPEVFFLNYKTPEEAERAQQQIQAQYDALGGTSQVVEGPPHAFENTYVPPAPGLYPKTF